MTKLTDAEHVAAQYKDASRFEARVRIYELYATNPQPWLHWLFDCLRLADEEVVLELGAGTGNVWSENQERIPQQVQVILSDLSLGMLKQAGWKLEEGQRPFRYLQCDAQQIPFPDKVVDAVLANHMLYHAPNRAATIAEAYRILRPGGRLYVGTNDWTHLQELRELVTRFEIESSLLPPGREANFFDLENAAEELSLQFHQLRLFRRQDVLEVKETEPLLDYIRSTMPDGASPAALSALEQHVATQIKLLGSFHVGIAIGVFEAVKEQSMLAMKSKQSWMLTMALLLLVALIVWLAPLEQSLGQGIKIVYVHVGLIWAGMLGFALNGLLGLVVAVTDNKKLTAWLHTIGRVALGVFVVSVIVSLIAEQVNWGAIFWQEPRNTAVFSVTAVAIIVLVLNSWLLWQRVQGLLAAGLAAYAILTLPAAPMVMHPENPARASSSMGIQSTFYGVFVLALLIGVWFVWHWRPRETAVTQNRG